MSIITIKGCGGDKARDKISATTNNFVLVINGDATK